MKNKYWHWIAVGLFFVISVAYMAPIVFEGKNLVQHDTWTGTGDAADSKAYTEETGKPAPWMDKMFSGQPVQWLPSINIFAKGVQTLFVANGVFGNGFGNVLCMFWYMLGFYILLIVLGCSPLVAIMGSIAYGLASYNLIIIDAGHIFKVRAMATIAPMLAGIILCYKEKYLWGCLTVLASSGLNIAGNHQQITYYALLLIGIMVVCYLVKAIQEKTWKKFLLASVLMMGLAGVSFLPNFGSWYPVYDYSKATMRGGSVLKDTPDGQSEQASGLSIDYAFQWSSGGMENFTLLVPGLYGGSSNYTVDKDAETYKATRQRVMPLYWGDMPFTSGPFYAGAIICFLFILGLFVVKGPEKWWLLIATVFSIMLGMGKNLMWFNQFMFDYLPMYNKFRVPSMALIIAGVTMPVMAALALKEIIQGLSVKGVKGVQAVQSFGIKGTQSSMPQRNSTAQSNNSSNTQNSTAQSNRKKYLKDLYYAAGITGGICLLFLMFGSSLFSFVAPEDARYPEWLQKALMTDRASLLQSDSFRSLAFILFGALMLLLFIKGKVKATLLGTIMVVLVLIDLWGVDKRFLNESHFVSAKTAKTPIPTDIDRLIMQDTTRYRVFNATVSTFNDATTSHFHNSIGGYSATKLRRYQDIIDFHFARRDKGINVKVLNMLNAKYFIAPDGNGQPQVQQNVTALGNAWFVDTILLVQNPDEEIRALYNIDPANTAVIDTSLWKVDLPLITSKNDSSYIKLVKHNLAHLTYESNNSVEQVAVFSEVFYKTWKAYIDGEEVPIFQTNYILRGIKVPAGKHVIEFKCRYELAEKASSVSLYASIFVGLIFAGLIVVLILRRRKSLSEKQ
ncbi:MAG: YfhO family protein [Bacteroidales bacterium]|jgi:hypothetical protein|nr:YfhO family protein [Bacteroidales bacterium]